MKEISKRFFLVSIGVALAFVAALALLIASSSEPPSFAQGNSLAAARAQTAMYLLLIALVPLAYAGVLMAVLFHRMWSAIQDGQARTTPGKAVGFLFIPVFNLYWAFQSIWGWAKDYNAYAARHGLTVSRMPEGLFLAYPILVMLTAIPVVGWLAFAANYFVGLTMIARICDGVNALPGPDRLEEAENLD